MGRKMERSERLSALSDVLDQWQGAKVKINIGVAFGVLLGFALVSCVGESPRNTTTTEVPIVQDVSKHPDDQRVVKNPSVTEQSRLRTVSTALSQQVWPSTEGNLVEITYRDSLLVDVEVVVYGETGRTEYFFASSRGEVTRGKARRISYRGSTIEAALVKTVDEDTCTYEYVIAESGTIHCVESRTKVAISADACLACRDFVRNLTTLVREVERLIVANKLPH
jgi:hypothetical protein